MKYISLILIFLAVGLGQPTEASAQKSMDEFSLLVDGLGCPFCAYGLEKKFREFKGIKGIRIDMETGFFTFSYPADKSLALEEVMAQVEVAGYTPMESRVKRSDGSEQFEGIPEVVVPENAVVVEASFAVSGKCDMCRARIEKTANQLPGMIESSWNQQEQTLAIKYDEGQVSATEVEMAISRVGHDTENHKASDKSYKRLHGCCKYDRVL